LEQRCLSHRIITEKTDLEKALDNVIDYSVIDDYSECIEKSKDYLKKVLCDD
jgi:hypothetical protein